MMPRRSPSSFDALYRAEHEGVLRYLRKRVGSDAASDLAQECFVRLLRSGALEGLDNPRAYLFRIARNLLIDRARRAIREHGIHYPFDDGRDACVPAEQAWRIEAMDVQRAYQQALRKLPDKARRVFMMHRLHHLTYQQIAEQLGISTKTVEYHMSRALARCRRAIAAQGS
jgi:RNA polymerase sigma-70 factor (ECF subfamily)